MKLWIVAGVLVVTCTNALANAAVWEPSAGHTQIPIWPGVAPDLRQVPGPETVTQNIKELIAGRPTTVVTNVTRPTMTVYAPKGTNTGVTVIVDRAADSRSLRLTLKAARPATGSRPRASRVCC